MFQFPIAVSADWHIGRLGYGKIDPITGFHTQTLQIIFAAQRLCESMIAYRSKHLFIVGDIFHKRNPSAIDWEAFNTILDIFIKAEIHVHLSPGNHEDLTMYTTALTPLTHTENKYIDLVNDKKSFINDSISPVELLMFSYTSKRWTKEKKSFSDIITELPKKTTEKRICLCHEMIDGSSANNKIFKSSLSSKVLQENFDLVIAGDIHRYQEVSHGVLYCGPLVHMDFGDRDIQPGYLLVNYLPDGLSKNFILSSTHIPIMTREFYQFSGDAASVWDALQKSNYIDNVVKLIVTDTVINISKLSQQVKPLIKSGATISIESHPIRINRVRKSIDVGADPFSQYTTYMKDDFDPDTIDLGKAILDEVRDAS